MGLFSLNHGGAWLLALCVILIVLPSPVAAFGAGNIPSIAQVEGHNWRHGDIEDMLATLAFIKGKKWSSMAIKRVYFGNWLRDYSQAIDVGSLKGPVNADTIRVLVWVLSFMAFGYATEEFEVTADRLGVYRAEEHIDNPLGYAEGFDARKFDSRLRGPVRPIETEIDMRTGMKNYIANETGDWPTSAGYLRFSIGRCIHYGRLYTCGSRSGREEDLCEALRCLGQALHCLEDWGAHTNYSELVLIDMGHREVFPHCGRDTQINIRGKKIYPLVTGTFGGVDFLHSVIGAASDSFTQSEVDEVDVALKNAEGGGSGSGSGSRGFGGLSGGGDFISLVGNLPGVGGGFAAQARELKAASEDQERENRRYESMERSRDNPNQVPGMNPNIDPVKISQKIYPILEFRDKIVKAINAGISKIPGLEKILDHISETLTAFILGLLAPFIRPIIQQGSKILKDGSENVISASAKSQLEPWNNPRCSDPTHSMLSKDHFTNILNSCGGMVAVTILQYAVPRIMFAWENPNVPVNEIVNDILQAFHHPALRDERIDIQRDMYATVRKWFNDHPKRHEIPRLLSSESVKAGKNNLLHGQQKTGSRGGGHSCADGGHGKVAGGLWSQVRTRDFRDDVEPEGGAMLSPGFPAPKASYGYAGEGLAASFYSGQSPQPSPGPSGRPGSSSAQQSYYGGSGSGYGQNDRPGSGYKQHDRPGSGYKQHDRPGSGYGQQHDRPGSGYGQRYDKPTPGYGQQHDRPGSGYQQQGRPDSGYHQQSSAPHHGYQQAPSQGYPQQPQYGGYQQGPPPGAGYHQGPPPPQGYHHGPPPPQGYHHGPPPPGPGGHGPPHGYGQGPPPGGQGYGHHQPPYPPQQPHYQGGGGGGGYPGAGYR